MEHILLSRALLQLVLMDFQEGQGKNGKKARQIRER